MEESKEVPEVTTATPEEESMQDTMQSALEATPPTDNAVPSQSKHKGRRFLFVVLGLIFVAGVTCGTYYVLHAMQTKNNTSQTTASTAKAETTTQKAATTSTDSAITTSLNDIDSRLTQATTDQANANTAVSDSDQQITVPTE